jgi:hypothetical protein
VPVNDVVTVMGHEKASTTLNLYTHRSPGSDDRVRGGFADDSLTAAVSPFLADDEDEAEDVP